MVIHKIEFSSKSILRMGLLIIFSFLFGYFLPYLLARHENVYFHDNLKAVFLSSKVSTLEKQRNAVKLYDEEQSAIKTKIDKVKSDLNIDSSNLKDKIELLEFLEKEKLTQTKPISFRPLYLNHLMFFWVFVFITLLFNIFFVSEIKFKSIFNKKDLAFILKVFLLLYPIYRLPSWLRNLPEGQIDAKIVYFANLNFSPLSFYYQEFEAFLVTLFLCIIICQWVKLYRNKIVEFDSCPNKYFDKLFDFKYIDQITSTFFNWQLASICLLPTFIWYATYYWNNVIINHDTRYILPSIIIHTIIIIVWIIVSLPNIITWYDFSRCKIEAKKIIQSDTNISIEEKSFLISEINDLKPVAFWNIAISSASGIFSIIFPLLGAFK